MGGWKDGQYDTLLISKLANPTRDASGDRYIVAKGRLEFVKHATYHVQGTSVDSGVLLISLRRTFSDSGL